MRLAWADNRRSTLPLAPKSTRQTVQLLMECSTEWAPGLLWRWNRGAQAGSALMDGRGLGFIDRECARFDSEPACRPRSIFQSHWSEQTPCQIDSDRDGQQCRSDVRGPFISGGSSSGLGLDADREVCVAGLSFPGSPASQPVGLGERLGSRPGGLIPAPAAAGQRAYQPSGSTSRYAPAEQPRSRIRTEGRPLLVGRAPFQPGSVFRSLAKPSPLPCL